MTYDSDEQNAASASGLGARRISRRRFIKAVTAGTAFAAAAPYIVRSAVGATSGELIVGAFSDYVTPEMKDAFEKQTGIKVTVSEYGSVDIVLNQLRANQGQGYDIFYAPINYGDVYCSQSLLKPLDESKIHLDAVIASLLKKSEDLGALCRADRILIPYSWGTNRYPSTLPYSDRDRR
jgi:spermidine/putrescine transport system substrate-binding protein